VHPGDTVQVSRWGRGVVQQVEHGRAKVYAAQFGATGAVIYAPYSRCERIG
jgi:hypothetical protein